MNLTTATLRRPITTIMIFISIFVVGLISLHLLPIEFFPDIDAPFLFVEVPYPNSTPEETERQITRPIEEVLAMIGDIREMRSWSANNSGQVLVIFYLGVDIDVKALTAREKIDGIRNELPADVERILIHRWSSTDEAILNLRLSSNRDLSNAYDILNRNLIRRLERIDGVARVTLYGVEPKEISIQLDVNRIIAHKIDITNLVETLMSSNFSLTAGRVTDGVRRLAVRPVGEFSTLEDYQNLIIGKNNLKLEDVADVTLTHPRRDYGRHLDRKYAVGIDIYKESGTNTVDVTERILNVLNDIKDNPEMAGIQLYEMENQAEGIISSLNELFKSGLLGAFLAVGVLFFFLRRWAPTIIVTLAVPVSLLVALACMYFLEISLNILSMMGLLLAVGMLVDNAVVATESINRHQQLNPETRKATISGVREIALAITAGTLTTIIVFLPQIVSTSDQLSLYLRHISIALCISLLASLIIAQTIVPLLTSRLKPSGKSRKKTLVDRMIQRYQKILGWTLHHRLLTVTGILLILASIILPGSLVKFDLFPDNESDRKLRLHYNINDSYTLEEVEKTVDMIEEYLYQNQELFEIRSVYSYFEPGYAMSTILLTTDDAINKTQKEIMELIRKDLPRIAIGKPAFEHSHNTGREGGIQIQLIGKSSERLAELSRDVAWTLSQIPGINDARSDAEAGNKEVQVVVDRSRSNTYGFTTRQIAQTVSAAMRGIRLRKFKTREGEIDVKLEFQEKDRQNLENLENLPLFANGSENLYKLTSLADLKVMPGPQRIFRQDRITSMGVSARLKDITVNEAREKISKVLGNYQFPPGYSWNYGERFNYEEEATQNMLINMLLALALIYFVMASLFESLIFPAGIWSSIFFAIVGVYWFFLITDTVMSFMAMLGILLLIGVVVNNGIVLIDHIIQLRNQGMSREAAILQAGRDRLRPIIMTAATTIFSLLPLSMVATQVGGNGPPYYPMARAIVGGLSFSTLVTLLILPTIYILLDDMRNWARRLIQRALAR